MQVPSCRVVYRHQNQLVWCFCLDFFCFLCDRFWSSDDGWKRAKRINEDVSRVHEWVKALDLNCGERGLKFSLSRFSVDLSSTARPFIMIAQETNSNLVTKKMRCLVMFITAVSVCYFYSSWKGRRIRVSTIWLQSLGEHKKIHLLFIPHPRCDLFCFYYPSKPCQNFGLLWRDILTLAFRFVLVTLITLTLFLLLLRASCHSSSFPDMANLTWRKELVITMVQIDG